MTKRMSEAEAQAAKEVAESYDALYPLTNPVNRQEMEHAVRDLYVLARLNPPQHFVWTTNPVEYRETVGALVDLNNQTQHYYWWEIPANVGADNEVAKRIPEWKKFRNIVTSLVVEKLPLDTGVFQGLTPERDDTDGRYGYYDSDPRYKLDQLKSAIPDVSQLEHATGASRYDGSMQQGVFSRRSLFYYNQWASLIKSRGGTISTYVTLSLQTFERTVKYGGLWTAFEGGVVLCENPTSLVLNTERRPNNADGPAVEYPGGYKAYYINGVSVPEALITDPSSLTVEQIVGEQNQEIRRVMIEKMGIATFLKRVDATLEDEDEDVGKLWSTTALRDDVKARRRWGETETVRPAKFLEVKNSTPEPDGSVRTFFLRVPPRYKTAKGAKAFTFNRRMNDFHKNLVQET